MGLSFLLKQKKGFSLIEVMIAIGLLGISSMALMTILVDSQKSIANAVTRTSEVTLLNDLNRIFSDKDLCQQSISTPSKQALTTSAPFNLKINTAAYGLIEQGAVLKNGLTVTKFYMDSFSTPISTGVSNELKSVGTLWLQTTDTNKLPSSIERKKRSVGTFTLYFDATTKEILSCFGASSIPVSEMCQAVGFIWDGTTSTCNQPPSSACANLGGSWSNGKCTFSNLVINGTGCSSSQFMTGVDGSGKPICASLPTTTSSSSSTSTTSTTPTAKDCTAGSTPVTSADGSNTCTFSWGAVTSGTTVSAPGAVTSSNGGTGTMTCSNGVWGQIQYLCPSKTSATCAGGSYSWLSPDASNSCSFTWSQATPGTTIKPAGTNGGTANAICMSDGNWQYTLTCPNKATTAKVCPQGQGSWPSSSGAASCNCYWNSSSAGSNAVGSCSKGSISGTCGSDGAWKNVTVNCP